MRATPWQKRGHPRKDNHEYHGVPHVLEPVAPPDTGPAVDRAENQKAEDAGAGQGDVEADRDRVDGAPAVQEKERHGFVHAE